MQRDRAHSAYIGATAEIGHWAVPVRRDDRLNRARAGRLQIGHGVGAHFLSRMSNALVLA
jgi:hypothetical protein